MKNRSLLLLLGSLLIISTNLFSDDEDIDRGGIEEITVTAEKRTSTVSDTSMSIDSISCVSCTSIRTITLSEKYITVNNSI